MGNTGSNGSLLISERPSGSSRDDKREGDSFGGLLGRLMKVGESVKRGLSNEPSLYVLLVEWEGEGVELPEQRGFFKDSMVQETCTEGGEGGRGEGESS